MKFIATLRSQRSNRSLLTMRWFFLVFAIWSIGVQSSQEPPQAPRIEVKQKAEKIPPTQENTKPQFSIAASAPTITSIIPVSAIGAHKSSEQIKDGGEQGTEFWPPIFGYRLKVTDTLLVAFTALLFAATVFLYCATRDLVHGADETAKKELRSYVALEDISFVMVGSMPTNHLVISMKNYGQTPSFDTSIRCRSNTKKPTTFVVGDHPGVGKQMLHPGMRYSIQVNEDGSPTYQGENAKGWIWGQIIYKDIYEQWWRTNFFYIHHGENKFTPEKEYNNEKGPFNTEGEAFSCTEI